MATHPPYLVLPPPSDLDKVARDLTRRGWRVHRGFTPAEEPWDLAPTRVVAIGVVGDRDDAEAALLCAVRGAGLVVTLDEDRSWAPRFLHDLARLEPSRATPPSGPPGRVTSSQVAPGRPGPPRPDEPAGGQDAGDREGAVTGGQVSAPAQALTGSAPSPAGGAAAGAAVGTLTTEQCDLLDLLAAGHSIAEAARMRYLSLRTANRRVADARATLGVPTTREAVLAYLRLRGR